MIPALFLSLMLATTKAQAAGLSGPYVSYFSAFDTQGNYLYKRTGWLFVGPAEKADGYPEPPALEIRDLTYSVYMVVVPEGEKCAVVPSATVQDYGGGFVWGCRP